MKRVVLLLLALAAPAQAAGVLRYGLEFDPDVLDPARAGSYTDRIVFASMCDQLLDVDQKLDFMPQLATAWEWSADNLSLVLHLRSGVHFHDGEMLDAAAVQANFRRNQEEPESQRRTELKPLLGVDAIDPLTVRLRLSAPYAPLLSLLANRPGMMLSPRTLNLGADAIAGHPVCAGPFRFVQRVAQDRIVLERFPDYWNAGAIGPDRIVFQPIPDSTVRLVNLQSGALDIVNRTAPSDVDAVRANSRLRLVSSPSIGFQLISFNLAHGPQSDTPLGRDRRVREAFEKSIDRAVLNQVVMDGQYVPSNQTEPPGTRYWDPDYPVPPRDLEGAKALLREAGLAHVGFTLLVGNDPVNGQIGQVLQSMAAEAGIDVTLRQMESVAQYAADRAGDYQASMSIWSGRPDPDGNASVWAKCDGFLNWGEYCYKDLDALFVRGASITDPAGRVPVYRAITDILQRDRSHIVLFHYRWLWSMSTRVEGFRPMPDGITRPAGLRLRD